MYNVYVHKERLSMTVQSTTMSDARAHFAEALDTANSGEVVLIRRSGKPDAAIVDAEILEDFLAASNSRLIKKVQAARKEKETISFDDTFSDVL
jgi:prevent-host-death family protein